MSAGKAVIGTLPMMSDYAQLTSLTGAWLLYARAPPPVCHAIGAGRLPARRVCSV